MTCFSLPLIVTLSLPPATFVEHGLVRSSWSRSWSKYATSILVPRSMVPLSGVSRPSSRLSRVDLPQPLGPMMPMRSPRRMVVEIADDRVFAPEA